MVLLEIVHIRVKVHGVSQSLIITKTYKRPLCYKLSRITIVSILLILISSVKSAHFLLSINDNYCVEQRKNKGCCSDRYCKLFIDKNKFKIMRVDCNIASILPFEIDVPSFYKSI